jgi:tetratricopeptide (TPR) repeat protein
MKVFLLSLIHLFYVPTVLALVYAPPTDNVENNLYRRRGELIPLNTIESEDALFKAMMSEFTSQKKDLRRVKFYLINGEVRMAKMHLRQMMLTEPRLRPLGYRYLATIEFILGNYQDSLKELKRPELSALGNYRKVCVLRILNQIILNDTFDLADQWDRCLLENIKEMQSNRLLWLETLVRLKTAPSEDTIKAPFKYNKIFSLPNDDIKIVLKLALYLNQEKLVIDEIMQLTFDAIVDPEIRELAGLILFRAKKFSLSFKFIEDLNTANINNIKGNLYLMQNKYELAFAQFKLALIQKQNSLNAMERALPLSWEIGQWEEGTKLAEQVITSPEGAMSKLALTSAFYVQRKLYKEAEKRLDYITTYSTEGDNLTVTQLYSYNHLMQKRSLETIKYADLSCKSYDLAQCWLLYQFSYWDHFPLTILRDEPLFKNTNWWSDESALTTISALKETIYVNQKDIEELDDALIKLIPVQK